MVTARAAAPGARGRAARCVVSLTLVALVAVACGSQQPAGDAVAGSETLFAANCAVCHGTGGSGTDLGPPLVDRIYEPSHHGDDAFERAVRQGVFAHHWSFGPMPPVPGLDDDELRSIIAYVRELQEDAGIG